MATAADIIPGSVKDSLLAAISANRRSVSESIRALHNKILASDRNRESVPALTTACDDARNNIEAAVAAHLSSFCSCFSSEYVKMAEEYELCVEEMKRQHEVKISLMRAENNVLKLSLEGKTRTLNIMKAIEKRSQIEEKSWEEYQREQAKIVSILKEEKLAQTTAKSLAEEMKLDIGNLRLKVNNRAKKFSAIIAKKHPSRIHENERGSQNSSLPASSSTGTKGKTEASSQAKLINHREVDDKEKVVIKVGKEVQKLGIFLKTVETCYKTRDGDISQKEVVVTDIRHSCVFQGLIGVGELIIASNYYLLHPFLKSD